MTELQCRNEHIWVHWMNAMLFAVIRGPKLTKQWLFEDWWNPPSSPKRVSTEAPKPMTVKGKPTRWWSNQAKERTYMSPLDECYAFCHDQGTKTYRAATVWRLTKLSPLLVSVVAIGVILYLFNEMINDKYKGTKCKEWTQWMMTAFFSMKIRPKLTSRCVLECLQVAIIVEIQIFGGKFLEGHLFI